jgi:cytochrome c
MTEALRLSRPTVALAALLTGACPAWAAPMQEGRALAQKNCAPCHAVGPKGASPNPKSPPFRMLGQRYPIDSLQEALAEGITVGHEGLEMPEFRFAPAQIDALVAYIKRLNAGQVSAGKPKPKP